MKPNLDSNSTKSHLYLSSKNQPQNNQKKNKQESKERQRKRKHLRLIDIDLVAPCHGDTLEQSTKTQKPPTFSHSPVHNLHLPLLLSSLSLFLSLSCCPTVSQQSITNLFKNPREMITKRMMMKSRSGDARSTSEHTKRERTVARGTEARSQRLKKRRREERERLVQNEQ